MRDKIVEILDESMLRHMAHVMGDSSASAQALKDAEMRRSHGEQVCFYRTSLGTILVGPPLEPAPTETDRP